MGPVTHGPHVQMDESIRRGRDHVCKCVCVCVFHCFSWFFMKLDFKELDFTELGVLGYLLGVPGYSDLLGMGVLGYSDLLGVGIDEWKSRCNVPPSSGTWIGHR